MASLAPLVIGAADEGDDVAVDIVDEAVEALFVHVTAAFAAVESSGPAPELVLWGGLVAQGGPLRSRLVGRLEAAGIRPVSRALDPPLGAARLALAELERAE